MGYFFRPAIYKLLNQAKSCEHREEILKSIDSMFSYGDHYRFNDVKHYEQPIWRSWGCFIHEEHYAEFMKKIFTIKGTIYECVNTYEYDGDCLYSDDTSWVRRYPENYSYNPKPLVFKLRAEFKKLLLSDETITGEWGWIYQHKKHMSGEEWDKLTAEQQEDYDEKYDPIKSSLRELVYILMGPFEEWVAW